MAQFEGFIELGTGGTRYSSALAINDFGEIVGLTGDTRAGMVRLRSRFQGQLKPRPHDLGASFERAMIWTDIIGLQNLNSFVASSDWTLGAANGINNKGEIVGTAFNSAQLNQAFVLEPK